MEINTWQVAKWDDEQYYPLFPETLAQTEEFNFSMIAYFKIAQLKCEVVS